jgi:multiple sugar transport system substrate-binding protein
MRAARLILGTVAVVSLAGGCADDEQAATTVLRVANWGSPAVESSFMELERQILEEFEALHPGVRVQIEQIPGAGQYAPKLLMMHVTGSVPDVIHLDASSAAVFIDNDVLRDLTPLVENDPGFNLEDFFANVVDIARRGEKLYAIPLDFTPMVMYYNKRLFDEADVPHPRDDWTWDEFLTAARRLTILGEDRQRPPLQYGFNFENTMPFWVLWLWTNGGDVLDPTGTRASGYFDGPRSIEAVQFLVDLMTTQRVAPHPQESMAAGADLFLSQRAAMDLKGHWMIINYRADGIDFGVVGLPTNGVDPVTVIYEAGLAITTRAEHPDLAWEYIKFITSRDVQIRRVSSGLAISANRRAATHFAGNPVEDAFIEQVKHARPPWGATVERYPFIEELGREMLDDILYSEGELSVEEAMHETAKLIDAALAEP